MQNKISFTSYSPSRIVGCADILKTVNDHFELQGEFGTQEPHGTSCCNIVTRSDGKICKCAVGALMSPRALDVESRQSTADDLSDETIEEIHSNFDWRDWSNEISVSLSWEQHPATKARQFRAFLKAIQAAHDGFSNPFDWERSYKYRSLRFQQLRFVISESELILREALSTQDSIETIRSRMVEPHKVIDGSKTVYIDNILNAAMAYATSV